MSRFVFLDRDGTLVRDTGYPHRPEDYELLPGVIGGLQTLAEAGYRFAIVTNQSGIGRGFFDEAAFHAFNELLFADLAESGIEIAATFFCPHTPEAGCSCRKPLPGLIDRARNVLGATLAESWLIGDSPGDAGAGLAAGCRGVVLTGTEECPDLAAAASHILTATNGR